MQKPYSIAVVGLGGIFPSAPDVDAFWKNIVSGHDATREVPPERWPGDPQWFASRQGPDSVSSLRACLLDGIPTPECARGHDLDDLSRLSVAAAEMALNDCRSTLVNRSRVATILASIALPTAESSRLSEEFFTAQLGASLKPSPPVPEPQVPAHWRRVTGQPAQMVAKLLGLGGYTLTLDAACASSLYAVKLACDALAEGQVDAVLAGGANRADSLYTQAGFTALGASSPTGRCSPFDSKGDGLVVGEGAGFLLLKRLDDALAQGDLVYAVIRGIGLSNDIGGSLLAPDSEGQLRALQEAYAQAGWAAADVGLVECHGTGTPMGDRTEFRSLQDFWPQDRPGQTVLGSVKSQIGHLLTGAAAAGLIKVIQAIRHRTLPPMNNFESPARGIELDGSPFRILCSPQPWDSEGPLRAGVSAFGFGGINGHVLLEEYNESGPRHTEYPEPREVVVTGVAVKMGQEHDLDRLLLDALTGSSAASPRPAGRWPDSQNVPGQLEEIQGAFLEELEVEAGEFRVPPRDLPEILLQQSLLLAAAGQATRQSSLGDKQRCRRSGALIGISLDLETTNFHLRWGLPRMLKRLGVEGVSEAELERLRETLSRPLDSTRTLGALGSVAASRAAREFSLGGPSYAISCAEASGVRALEIGVRAIKNGEMDSCLVGAIDLAGDPRAVWAQDQERPYLRGTAARPYDQAGAGATVAEGAVALVLKSRQAAEADGDRILARVEDVISAGGDESLARVVAGLAATGVRPGFVDTLSGGKASEDREFLRIWQQNFPPASPEQARPTALGAAVANVGEAGAASGLLAVARAVQALDSHLIPGLPHLEAPLETAPGVYLPGETAFWWHDHREGPRYAAAVGQGQGGDAFALLLRAGSDTPAPLPSLVRAAALPAQLFLFAWERRAELRKLASEPVELSELARRWHGRQAGGNPIGARAALVARSREELLQRLDVLEQRGLETLDGQAGIFFRQEPLKGETAWVFPGSGNHYPGMGRELAALFPEVAAQVCSEAELSFQQFTPWLSQPFDSALSEGEALAQMEAHPLAPIFGQVTYAILAARVLGQFLPQPEAAIGYSLGESAALFATGAWRERDRMFERTVASPLFARQLRMEYEVPRQVLGLGPDQPFQWRVAVLNRPESEVRAGLEAVGRPDLFLLIVNTLRECVVGGQAESVEVLASHLGCEAFSLDGVPVVHCPLMHPVAEAYHKLHRLTTKPPVGMRFYNGHRHQSYIPDRMSAATSITENAQFGFNFPKLVEAAYADGIRHFLEIGPGGSCSRMVREILQGRPHSTRSMSLPREGSESFNLLRLLAAAYVNGIEVNLDSLYPSQAEQSTGRSRPRIKIQAGQTLARALKTPVEWTPPAPPPRVQPVAPRPSPPATQVPDRVAKVAAKQATPVGNGAPSAKARRALVWRQPSEIHPKTLTKDGKIMTPQPGNGQALEPVIGLHPDYAGDPGAALAASIVESTRQTALAHESYLALMEKTRLQMESLLGGAMGGQVSGGLSAAPHSVSESHGPWTRLDPGSSNPVMRGERPARTRLAFDREQCMEFAIGSVGKVLGPMFARVDHHNVRVRLPDEPLMLCDRILTVEGEPGSLGSGRLTTEHDVFPESWYLDHDRAPVCISVEAGQADLFLCSYLGIDLHTGGDRAYRLLDATVSFHRGLPVPGETILYDIRINRFVKQGEVYLFFFEFDGTINGEPLITMRNGCAGFHTYEEIEASGGIVLTRDQKAPAPGKAPANWMPLAPFPRGLDVQESYNDSQVRAFRDRDLAGCFGEGFAGLALQRPYGLPHGRMKLFDRVLKLEPKGGRFGLGQIECEADIHEDDWFLTCHFKDDMVMPGTLMYECCAHSLRFLLARMGWVCEESEVAFEPRLNTPAILKCRGPVLVTTKKVLYRVDIKEIGYGPEPYVLADALMFGDGKPIVRFVDMSMKLTGVSEQRLREVWGQQESTLGVPMSPSYLTTPAIYDKQSIMEFSNGRPSLAFGPEYEVFDQQRRIARLPGPPFQFMDRVVEVNPPKFVLKAGDWIEAHYDVPPDEWYFAANRQDSMAYAILLEAALQPCGWLAAYCGSALRSETDVKFRNLGGTATLYRELFPEIGTIRMRVRMTDVSEAGGMIIENFDMEVYSGEELIYRGTTYFGFFSPQALANQVGVRDAAKRTYTPTPQEWAAAQVESLPVLHPLTPEDRQLDPHPAAALPAKALMMMDQVDIFLPRGGAAGLGFIQGSKIVDPEEWFFKAHFYQDPVWPGSLGLEAFLQLVKFAALRFWPEYEETHRFEPIALGLEHTWAYRGQVVPTNTKVIVDLCFTRKEGGESPLLLAQGFLRVDGIPIYEMTDFGLRLVPIS